MLTATARDGTLENKRFNYIPCWLAKGYPKLVSNIIDADLAAWQKRCTRCHNTRHNDSGEIHD